MYSQHLWKGKRVLDTKYVSVPLSYICHFLLLPIIVLNRFRKWWKKTVQGQSDCTTKVKEVYCRGGTANTKENEGKKEEQKREEELAWVQGGAKTLMVWHGSLLAIPPYRSFDKNPLETSCTITSEFLSLYCLLPIQTEVWVYSNLNTVHMRMTDQVRMLTTLWNYAPTGPVLYCDFPSLLPNLQ